MLMVAFIEMLILSWARKHLFCPRNTRSVRGKSHTLRVGAELQCFPTLLLNLRIESFIALPIALAVRIMHTYRAHVHTPVRITYAENGK